MLTELCQIILKMTQIVVGRSSNQLGFPFELPSTVEYTPTLFVPRVAFFPPGAAPNPPSVTFACHKTSKRPSPVFPSKFHARPSVPPPPFPLISRTNSVRLT